MKYWIGPIAFRLFVSAIVAVLLFVMISLVFLHDASSSVFESVLPVYLSIIIGLILGFWLPGIISYFTWNNKWKQISTGELVVAEYLREKSFKNGLRFLFSPLSSPFVLNKRVEEYIKSWAFYALRERIKEDWIWEVYNAAWPFILTNQNAIKVLKQILLNIEILPEEAFKLALHLYRHPGENYDLALIIANEGFKYNEDELTSLDSEALFHAWISVYAVEDGEIKQKILPKILRKFLSTERRDHVAAKIYIDAYNSGKRSQPLYNEIKRTSEVLKRSNKYPNLTALLDKIYNSSGIKEFSDTYTDQIIEEKTEDLKEEIITVPEVQANEESEKEITKEIPEKVDIDKASSLRIKTEIAEDIKEEIEENVPPATVEEKKEVIEIKEEVEERKPESTSEKHLRFVPEKSSSGNIISAIFRDHKIAILGALSSLIIIVVLVISIVSFSNRWTNEYLSPPGNVTSDAPLTLQFHAAKSSGNAIDRIKYLRSKNVDAYIVHPPNSKWYKIRSGAFYDQDAARVFADSLKKAGIIEDYYIARFEKGYIPETDVE